jgi:hypothetical protein
MLTYNILYNNTTSNQHIVDITDTYDPGDLTFAFATLAPTSTIPGTVYWDNQIVNASSSLSINVSFTLARRLPSEYILTNLVSYTADIGSVCSIVPDINSSNNSSSVNTPLSADFAT